MLINSVRFRSAIEMLLIGFAVILLTASCATQPKASGVRGMDRGAIGSSALPDITAALEFVERQVVDPEGRPIYDKSNTSGRLNMSEMSPIQLLVVALHFYDTRRALIIGNYENGPGDDRFWTVGDKLYHLFREEFFADNRRAMLTPPPYLASVEAAFRWMLLHGYDMASMKKEFLAELTNSLGG